MSVNPKLLLNYLESRHGFGLFWMLINWSFFQSCPKLCKCKNRPVYSWQVLVKAVKNFTTERIQIPNCINAQLIGHWLAISWTKLKGRNSKKPENDQLLKRERRSSINMEDVRILFSCKEKHKGVHFYIESLCAVEVLGVYRTINIRNLLLRLLVVSLKYN